MASYRCVIKDVVWLVRSWPDHFYACSLDVLRLKRIRLTPEGSLIELGRMDALAELSAKESGHPRKGHLRTKRILSWIDA